MNKRHNIFLIDGIGATISALFLGFVLPDFSSYFLMPYSILYSLAIIATCFAFFSFSCYFVAGKYWRFLLFSIALANSLYTVLTLFTLIYFYQLLSLVDMIYFIIELFVLSILIVLEFKMYTSKLT